MDRPVVMSATELDNGGFLGETVQVALVTDDLHRALAQLMHLGIGPWTVFEFNPTNSDMLYRGEDTGFSMKLAFTSHQSMMWEVIQPTGGRSPYQDFLDEGRQGFHHVAVDCNGMPFEERRAEFRRRGYEEVVTGSAFDGRVPFAYFAKDDPASPIVEIFEFPEGFAPEPLE